MSDKVNPLRPWRCVNPACTERPFGLCEYDFWAKEPVCPKCGANAKSPQSGHLIVELVIIHLDPPGAWGRGQGVYACTGKPFRKDPATGDPTVVTCPLCKELPAWKERVAAWNMEVVTEISDERMAELQTAAALRVKPKKDQTVVRG